MYYDPYLAHYGVKGMKWGVRRQLRQAVRTRRKNAQHDDRKKWKSMSKSERKANRDNPNSRYAKSNREADESVYGKGGVKRINRRMNKGQSYTRALLAEAGRTTAVGTAASFGIAAGFAIASNPQLAKNAGRVINNAAKMKAQDLINSAKAANAARQARNMIPRLADGVEQTIKLKPWQYKVR